MPLYLLKEQSPDASTPGWIVEPGAFGGMVLSNDDSTADLKWTPWIAGISFLAITWITYAFDVDDTDTGGGFTIVKYIIIAVFGLAALSGVVSSMRKVKRRERMGSTLVELEEPLLAPGLTTIVRIYQTKPLRIKDFVAELACFHSGVDDHTRLLDTTLCKLASAELAEGEVIWEGALTIPAEAEVLRISQAKLEDHSWEPFLNELGPSVVVADRSGGRYYQSRYWKIFIAYKTVEGVLINENYDLRVFFAEDRATLMAQR